MKYTAKVKKIARNECEVSIQYDDESIVYSVWCPRGGGYVYDITYKPGTSGDQICQRFFKTGNTLHCCEGEDLTDLIRKEVKKHIYDLNKI
jgi:hypothetical protein